MRRARDEVVVMMATVAAGIALFRGRLEALHPQVPGMSIVHDLETVVFPFAVLPHLVLAAVDVLTSV